LGILNALFVGLGARLGITVATPKNGDSLNSYPCRNHCIYKVGIEQLSPNWWEAAGLPAFLKTGPLLRA